MSLQEVSPERLAEVFHHYDQALASDSAGSSRSLCETWQHVPAEERHRLIAVARLALLELATTGEQDDVRRYFAKPGEAEWGC